MRSRKTAGASASLTILALLCLGACAIPVKQLKLEQPMTPAAGRSFVLTADAECSVGTGYGRTLRTGTRWQLFGTLREGEVYRSPDQVLTVEGYNVHEAYLIVKDGALVGFYLPVEQTLTPVSQQVRLSMTNVTGSN